MRLNMAITLRLLVTLTLLGALLVVTGVLGVAGMRASNGTVKQPYMNDVAAATALGRSNLNLTVVRTTLDRVLIHPESPDTPALIDKALNYLSVSNSACATYQALPASDEEAALSKAVADARGALLGNAIQPMIDAMRKGDHTTADKLAMTDIPPLAAALTQKSAALDKFRNDQGATRYQSAQDRYDTLLTFTLLAIALGLVACVTSGFSLLRSISRPLDLTDRHFERIAKGDMTEKLRFDAGDEMGKLVASVGTMQDGIAAMIEQITRGTDSIAAATHQISAGNNDLSQRTESQAASVEETAASMELEVALDEGTIEADSGSVPITAVELELKHGESESLYGVALELLGTAPLRIDHRSKADLGYELLVAEHSDAVKAQPVRLNRRDSIEDAFCSIAQLSGSGPCERTWRRVWP
ncbi:Tar ligand binding domain-containing protein [Paraburkholderia kirstenboschensis]|uniref:Tar ligand binding domain-containing protein n=1 Tax=Paraburkholderia kirstenboschensis TaxID=1245436 RepID=UPI0037432AEC